MLKRFILFCFLIAAAFTASADVFVVTSNADAGPGTLREALTLAAANGSAVKDYINFNIADVSEAGRTIILTSQLPDVSSNLVIDGSTQAGNLFGVSTSKVALFFKVPYSEKLSGLRAIEQRDIEIYGLYIKISPTISNPDNTLFYWTGIELKNNINVKIGAAGKGNVCFGFSQSISVNQPDNTMEYFDNLYIKGNFFGIDADGQTLSDHETQYAGIYYVTEQVVIGGTEAEGNVFAQGLMIYQQNNGNYTEPDGHYFSAEATILIKNNKIGVNYPVQQTIPNSYGLQVITIQPGGKNTTNIEDNVIASDVRDAIYIGNSGRKITILRNYIGTDKSRQKTFAIGGNGIFIYWATEVAVGSNNIADANYITNCFPVWVFPYSNTTVNKNSFYCVKDVKPMRFEGNGTSPYPFVEMKSITATGINGTATPNSAIELFYSDKCNTCAPQTYFGSATADNNGNWVYNGAITATVIASATLGLNTSNFTTTSINTTNVNIINACDDKGSITGVVVSNAKTVKWLNEQGQIAGTTADLIDVPPGKYKLIAENGDCGTSTDYYEIVAKLKLVTSNINIKPTSCNNSDGGISGITIINNDFDAHKISWKDLAGQEKGTDINLTGVPAGQYTLTVTPADGSCFKTYGPITINNTDGPVINTTAKQIQDATCGNTDGAITNIQVTGTGTYLWTNEQGIDVGHNKDLTGVPAGKYKLTVSSANCPPVFTALIEIPEINGITIDDTHKIINMATCQYDDGGISGIQVTGATKYTWYNANNVSVSNNLVLTGMPTGNYYLIAANNNGCSKQTAIYTIARQPPIHYGTGLTKVLKNATCEENNGSIEVIFQDPTGILPDSYKWVNTATGQVVNTSTRILSGIDAGAYDIYAISNGCERFLANYSIGRDPGLTVVTNNIHKNDDHCSSGTGSIKGIQATGATPLSFTWTDDNGVNKGASPDLLNVPAGTYHLKITDGSNCEQGFVYTIYDQSDNIAPPTVNDVQLCSPGTALLLVSNTDSKYGYRLYEDNNSATPMDVQQNGSFKVNVKAGRSYYISQYVGNCESTRQEVNVTISGISGADIANTFTPNGDGINDYWKITGMQSYTNGTVKVFSRDGRLVYQSKGYAVPFDGTLNGKPLPAGVYYYIIDLKSCSLISGSLTILR
jgi:gliding motility-associated-like protein